MPRREKDIVGVRQTNKQTYFLFDDCGVVLHADKSLDKVRGVAHEIRCFKPVKLFITDYVGNKYTLSRWSETGNLFNQAEMPERSECKMGWKEVEKVAAGPFVKFSDDGKTDTKRLYIAGDPEVIKARSFGGGAMVEDVGVLPVLEDGKFKVLTLRSSRLRTALIERWELINGKMVDVQRSGKGFDTFYHVALSKSKKKPDARLIANVDKAFAAFIKENKDRIAQIPDQ